MFGAMRALAFVALFTTQAFAQPVHPGTQPTPPVDSGEPALKQDQDQRRYIRGCDVGESCQHASELLREFELEAFPRPGTNPWMDERTPGPGRVEPIVKRKPKRGTDLRPDLPWLDKLEMPDLPITWTNRLIEYLVFYKDDPRGRSIMASWLQAQGRYRDMIVSHLRAAHLPEDLLYDSMIESSYDPGDFSSAGALGIWQFMPAAGKIYGLRQDHWVDERRDPLRSTIAQMDYFHDLYQRFGNWDMALAAFNAGYGAALRSIAKYNTNDYYQICEYENGLPWETCLYTPKVLAAAIVGHNRAFFGYDKIKEDPPEQWDEVTVPTSMSLSVVARAAGTTEDAIKDLNPQLKRGRTPPGETGYVVRVPVGAKADFARKLADLQTEWDGYDAYVMAHGERFEDVATTFGISLSKLRKLNDVGRASELEGGTVLVVPKISAEQREKNRAKAKAKLLGSGIDQKDGEPLVVPVPDKDLAIEGKQRVFYRVVAGDSLTSVAKALDVKKSQLLAWNGLDDDGKLHPRMVLQAFVDEDFDADAHHVALLDPESLVVVTRGSDEHLDIAEARTGRVRTEYTCKGKEKLADIAKKYGMGSHDLARINQISYDATLDPGTTIIVYEVADPKRSSRAEEQWKKMPRARRGKVATHDDDHHRKVEHSGGGGPVTRPAQVE
jgi:membrane-bound lytic murein transglycosylase D